MTDVALTLGGIVFTGMEVPDKLPFGGEQMLKLHKLVGGQRVVDAMGSDDLALEWSGRFFSPDALSRARAIDAMRKAGKAVTLSWSELSYTVVVKRFVADFEQAWNLPYSISCEVVADLSKPLTAATGPSIDDVVGADLTTSLNLGPVINDPTLSSNLTSLQSAMGAVQTFATATRSAINTVLAPLSAAQGQVNNLIGSVGGSIINTSVGGVIAGGDPASMASGFLAQLSAATEIGPLYDAQARLGRMAINLNAIGSAGQTATIVGSDLYSLATQAYGDINGWTDIARANGLTDPVLTGTNTLRIPSAPSGSGGVLQV
jgi:hypothetical protein